MITLFETLIEIVSVPLEKWDKLGFLYKSILLILALISILSIIIIANN